MSESQESRVFMFDDADRQMQEAQERARASFRYFWREMAWERRRIVPALALACVKAPFSDGKRDPRSRSKPQVEQMWLGQVDFDGRFVSGVLLNAPNWLKTVKAGDFARIPLGEISDWLYAIWGKAYGAHTVNLMRSRMAPNEREDHDRAWGLDFGDPATIRLVPQEKGWFGPQEAQTQEHPMSEAMASSLEEQLTRDPSLLGWKDDNGWTLLHHQALAGSLATVKVLLEQGADANALTDQGMTPRELAGSLGWDRVVALLESKVATR